MKRTGHTDPNFSLPALFGRGMDVARDLARDFARDLSRDFSRDMTRDDARSRFGQAGLSSIGPIGEPPFLQAPFPKTGVDAIPGKPAMPVPQKLVTDFRAYSGIRYKDALPPDPDGLVLGRLGAMEVRLARTARDVRRAQRLRYKVFYEEMSAVPDGAARLARRDMDSFDAICEHLLVLDHDAGKMVLGRRKPKVVGTYRLLRQEVAQRHGGFYTQGEFHVNGIIAAHPSLRFLELGRSCVLKPYRNKRTVELLWHGVWTYILRNKIDAMFGCASLEGTDPAALALPLSFLHHNALAPDEWRARAVEGRHVSMDRMPKAEINPKAALQALPPLIKGYLRLGGFVGDGAVVDHQFGTTDVLIILPVSVISPRYVEHFGPTANRHAI